MFFTSEQSFRKLSRTRSVTRATDWRWVKLKLKSAPGQNRRTRIFWRTTMFRKLTLAAAAAAASLSLMALAPTSASAGGFWPHQHNHHHWSHGHGHGFGV